MTTQPTDKTPPKRRASTRPIDAPQLLVGRVLDGRYRLDRVLNAGGMGIIFEACQLSVNRTVAVKVLKPTLTRDPSLVERFQLEVELVASMAHPHVVQLIDSGTDAGGLTYLVMEYVDGVTFRQALRRGHLRLADILEVFAQVCEALIEAHGQQIIHRDLKFDNIMLSRHRDGQIHVKLLDFGVAKLLSRKRELTQGGQVAGTPGIIAPELVDGKPPSARSDLYSLGVLLFTALAGEAPFRGENDLALMRAHKTEPLPNLRLRVGQAVPEEVIELTFELLEKEVERRPRDAAQVRDRLRRMRDAQRGRDPDAAIYIPPQGDALEETGERSPLPLHLFELEAEGGERPVRREGWIRFIFPQPLVAPMTVVTMMSLILILLIVTLMYMLYQQFGPPPG
ncbi:hypothetical protein DL240_17805 [Lujinxingia litoralis]|uniref:Protein kinase domain-containing protein n=1 Tax=Lujinxingia litoralis TaxID=2211119 RepID=A0A328C0Y7_9DELT|nr:serine/threonine-protein kinase [Lujinxingia litoralis]RAL20236.1 hypothetical protein DL240_17805 [Lujinxingia litoralis]